MSHKEGLLLGIEIGGTKLQLAVADTSGKEIQSLRYAINPADGASGIRDQLSQAWRQLSMQKNIQAIGVGFGGPVDRRSGTIRVSHQVAGWADFNLQQWLSELTRKPVVVENDANAAALAEALQGSGIGHERVFYMTIGSGIGGGMVVQGRLYQGRVPGEVEVGHLRLSKTGQTLETNCSGWAVNALVRAYAAQHPESWLGGALPCHPGPEAMLLPAALAAGDEGARQIVAAVADDLAFGLSHVVHLFHPDVLVIGGGLSLLSHHLLVPVAEKLPPYLLPAFLPPPPLLPATLGEKVVPAGALELAKRSIF